MCCVSRITVNLYIMGITVQLLEFYCVEFMF